MVYIPSLFFLALTLVVGGQALVIRIRDDSPDTSDTPQDEIDQYLKAHNDVRVQHGADNLTYSQDLAKAAAKWVDRCEFKHSGGVLGHFGENLSAGGGTGKDYKFSIADGIKGWADEDYDPSNPKASHFTQMVWKDTKEVGCAHKQCAGIFDGMNATYYVCEYSPEGNIVGGDNFEKNVQK